MIFVSEALDLLARLRGPVAQHRLHLFRMERWGKGEPEWHLLDHLVNPKLAAVDVGANVGDYAGRLAQLCPHVHAFEPIPWLADALVTKMPGNVTVHRLALSDRSGTAELRIPTIAGIEEHGLTTLEDSNQLSGSVRHVPCTLARLDDVVTEPVGLIKVDVEGHELAVLLGAERILKQHRPVLLIESDHKHNPAAPENVFQLLRNHGYAGFFLADGQPRGLGAFRRDVHFVNFIFVPDQ